MTLRTKLLLAQAPLGVILVAVCLLSVAIIASLGSHSQRILKDNYRSVLAAQRMKEAVERLEDGIALSLLDRDTAARLAPVTTYREQFERELYAQENNITEPGEQAVTQHVRALWVDYQQKAAQLGTIAEPEAAKQFYLAELAPRFQGLRNAAETILNINQDSMVHKSEEVRRIATRLNTITIVATLSALLLGFFVSTKLTSRLLRPLSVLGDITRRIGAGDFQAQVNITGNDEIARLATDFNAMTSHLNQYRNSSLGELLQAQNSLQAAIDSLPDPVVVFGISGDIRNVNTAAEAILGVRLEAAETDPLQPVDMAIRTVLERLRSHVLSGKGPFVPKGFEDALRVPSRDGDKYLLPRATPVYEMGGALIGATVILQEVTRLRRFDELKNDLVATVAHEFRTPLTSLRLAIHLCLEQIVGPVTEKQADLLHTAREDCERLQAMVDDLLDLSRIESGRVELQRRPASIAALVNTAVEACHTFAEGRGIQVSALVPAVDQEVFVDPERIALVLSNLLSNAIRHTPTGGQITVRVQSTNGHVRFDVTDTGEGIPKVYQQRLFDKFFRVPGASAGGAGLGLSIAREIVQGHGSEIRVESEVGQGSTFWFTLPLAGTGDTSLSQIA